MFFTYRQNNSGGYWKGPARFVIIEACCAEQANSIAKDHGLYFDGYGDCACCGNRWSRAYKDEGTEKPLVYDSEPEAFLRDPMYSCDSIMIVYKDNKIERLYGSRYDHANAD